MSVQSVPGNYTAYRKQGYTTKWTTSTNALKGGVQKSDYLSTYNNTCTDSADDGKITGWEKLKGIGKGAVRSLTNMVKGIVKNPLKSAAIVGVCCIPVVGKFIGLGLAAYGLVKSGIQLVQNAKAAGQAETDAQAKDAWENIGTSGFNAALSAVAIKGCASGIKYDLNGGSSTVNLYRNMKADGATNAEIYSNVAKSALKETGTNMAAIPKALFDKAKSVGKKAVDFYKSNKGESFTQTAGNMFKAGKEYIGGKYRSVVDKVETKVTEGAEKLGEKVDKMQARRAERAEAKAQAEAQKAQNEAQPEAPKAEPEAPKAEVEAPKVDVVKVKAQVEAYAKEHGFEVKSAPGGGYKLVNKRTEITFDIEGNPLSSRVLDAKTGIYKYKTYDKASSSWSEFKTTDLGFYDENVTLGFGKLTRSIPITNRTAANATPYLIIGEGELK